LIKNIIFDLGNVLVGVDFEKPMKKLLSEGVSKNRYNSFFKKKIGNKYECGIINTNEFLDSAYRSFGKIVPKKKIRSIFKDMFFEFPEMKKFLENISESEKFRLFLLSNTSPLHFNYIKRKFGYVNLIESFILSYRIKMVKPDCGVYKLVLNKYKMKPEETLFIDDLKENCESAEKFGIQIILFRNYKDFLKKFGKFINKV
jgi:glucose-1-phosphatase